MKKRITFSWAVLIILIATQIISCKKDKTTPDVIASFTFAVDATDFKKVTFTNESKNYDKLSWDFGDNSALSAEVNPVHTYAAAGDYTVKLTASGGGKSDTYSTKVTISDPNALLTALAGDVSKTWKLLRDVTKGRFPLEVGPTDHSQIWWAMGRNNDELANRPCMLNDEWTFTRDGLKMTYDPKGDYWAESGVFADPGNVCASTSDPMIGKNGENLSAWKGGTFTFVLTPGTTPTLKVNGVGAFVGFLKLGNGIEVSATTPIVVPSSLTYNIVKLTDATVDTLIIEGPYSGGPGYWRFVLVHYDNPADEPPIPGKKPVTAFTTALSGLTATITNTTTGATSYLWDFGDGQTSTEQNPTHTYAGDGYYPIQLTATNSSGSNTAVVSNFIITNSPPLTDALLQGGPWKIMVGYNTVFVGPGLGKSDWYILPKSSLDGTGIGVDDWSCMADDEFTFGAGGVYTYATKGSARNDGYFGTPNGCITDAQIAASGNGAAFGSATHSYVFTPATGSARAIITLTNGPTGAAFLGFYKGYYGGENTDKTKLPNGGLTTNKYEVMGYAKNATKEYLFVSVDISATHDGSSAWSMILVR